MTFPRVAAPKRGHKTDYYQMSKIFGGLLGYAVGFSLIYEYFNKGISRRREAWRNEPKRDMSASGMLTSQLITPLFLIREFFAERRTFEGMLLLHLIAMSMDVVSNEILMIGISLIAFR